MMRAVFLTAMLVCATAMPISLRGVKPEAKKPETNMLNSNLTDERGARGHLYYAQSCGDCVYRGEQCGCEPAVEYFACLTKHCYPSNNTFFAEKCSTLSNKCSKELDVQCRGSETVCKSKFNQLPVGGLGFSLDIVEDNAYCGPHGVCIGKIGLKVHIHNGPKEKEATKAPKVTVASPAPGPMMAAPPAPAAAASKKDEAEKIWLECGLPKKDGADIEAKQDWILCQQEVKGEEASCNVAMFKELQAGANKKGYCVLTQGKDGKRLTSPHWSAVINVHKKPAAAAAAAAEKPAAPKPAAAPKKEEKAKAAAPKKEEKPKAEEAPLVMGDTHKLPWMVEKEKRQVARKTDEDKKAKEPKTEDKKEAKATEEKPAKGVQNDSKLPWMAGKVNDKAAPSTVLA